MKNETREKWKRALALLLTLVMCLSLIPVNAFAQEEKEVFAEENIASVLDESETLVAETEELSEEFSENADVFLTDETVSEDVSEETEIDSEELEMSTEMDSECETSAETDNAADEDILSSDEVVEEDLINYADLLYEIGFIVHGDGGIEDSLGEADTIYASSTEDYRAWAQADSRWGSLYLGSSQYTVASSGCLVTAVTKLIIQCGLKSSDSFNVATLVNWLNSNSGFTATGDLYWAKPAEYVSGFSYYGPLYSYSSYSSSSYNDNLLSLIKQGYHIVLQVNSGYYSRVEGGMAN